MATRPDQPTIPDGTVYVFGNYELDTRLRELRCGAEARRIEPQVFDVLVYLVARRDRLVTKEELLDAVWGHRFVAPATLNSRIKSARQAVGDDGTAQRVIRTVHGRGFRVVGEVQERTVQSKRAAAASALPETLAEGVAAASQIQAAAGLIETDVAALPPEPRIEQRIRFCRSADGVRIAYATSGTGPPLVKPANWLTHLEYDWESPVWRHWLRELSLGHELIRYDERGCGLSDRDIEDFSFEAWLRDLETVVDEMELERFPLLALSQGCAVAVTYAARHPERVSRLVLYGGFVQGRFRRARTPEELEEARLVMQGMPLGWGRDNPAFRQFFATMFLPDGTPEQHRWFSELQRVTTSPANAVRLRTTAAEIDVTEVAPRVRAPTLVLHATGDAAVPFDQGRELAALVPGARFVPLDGRNHILLEDEPAWARFVQEVRNFLDEP